MKSLRTALVGLGGAAHRIHLPAIAAVEELDLVGAADTSGQARQAASRWKIPYLAPDVATLLKETRPDLVVVATPPGLHFEHAKAALEAGAHVLCEKPFVPTLAEADALIALSARQGRLLAVNNQYRFMRIYAETARRIAAGGLGELYQAQVWQQMFHPPETEANWRGTLTRYTLFEFGTHALDLLAFFFGALPVAVTARIPRVPHGYASDVLAVLLLDFPGGRVATVNLNRVSRAPWRYLEMRLDTREASVRLSLGGVARASLDWADGRPRLRTDLVKGGQARLERHGRSTVLARAAREEFSAATARHLRHLAGRIEAGDAAPTAAAHAREVLKTVFAAYRAAETGGPVRLDEFREDQKILGPEPSPKR